MRRRCGNESGSRSGKANRPKKRTPTSHLLTTPRINKEALFSRAIVHRTKKEEVRNQSSVSAREAKQPMQTPVNSESPWQNLPVVEEERDEQLPVPPISIERALKISEPTKREKDQDSVSHGSSDSNTSADANSGIGLVQVKSIVVPSFESHYTNPEHLHTLEEGGCLFSFVCNHELTPYEAEMFNGIINLTAFDDETEQNYVPHFEYGQHIQKNDEQDNDNDEDERNSEKREYTFLLARCAYLLVGVDVQKLLTNPSILSTFDYQTSCQPSGTTIWEDYDKMAPNNFRITKPIIPYLYNFTVQFRVSGNLSPEVLSKLGRHVGTRVDGGILLERTKRSVPPQEDATKKVKSVLLYSDLGKGVFLVTHLTVILQQGLPEIVEKAIDTFGQWGLGEASETAFLTRKFLAKVMPAEAPSSFSPDGCILLPNNGTDPRSATKRQEEAEEDESDSDERFYDVGEISDSEAGDCL